MVTVTSRAKRELIRILEDRNLDPGKFLRLTTPPVWEGEGGFGIVIDERGPTDMPVSLENILILLVDMVVAEQLSKSILDFKETPDGSRFTLDVF